MFCKNRDKGRDLRINSTPAVVMALV